MKTLTQSPASGLNGRHFHSTFPVALLSTLLLVLTPAAGQAGSATWNLNPATGFWSNAANWTPATVPDGPSDIATFGVSNTTDVFSQDQEVSSIVFDPDASPFTITISADSFVISGTGVTNNSGIVQNLAVNPSPAEGGTSNHLEFTNSATAGSNTQYTAIGADTRKDYGGVIEFLDTSSAGSAVIIVQSGKVHNDNPPGALFFSDSSTGGDATIINQGGPFGGVVGFLNSSTAGNAFITTNGARQSDDFGAFTTIANGGNATIVTNGGAAPDAPGGITLLTASGDTATFIPNGGTNGGVGGTINVDARATASARFEVFGNGFLNLQNRTVNGAIGSIEGDGLVLIAGSEPTPVGSNSLDTTFSGVIRTTAGAIGAITKVGSGRWTLTGANTYPDGATVSEGSLIVSNTTGSGTGKGPVQVSGGTLGGHGIIAGTITVGTGSGGGGFLAPAAGSKVPATLTTSSGLILNADATYDCKARAKTNQVQNDQVAANGVTINGATFSFHIQAAGSLASGTVLTVISNTSASPIDGTFGNLADGAIIIAGGNSFQANYEGGDGNDLTLTVVP